MHPLAFEIGPLQIRWYGVMAALGFLLATLIIYRFRKHADLSPDDVSTLSMVTIITGLIGARAFYVIQFFEYYENNLFGIIRIDQGGLVFYGGLLAIVGLWGFCKIKKKDFVCTMDIVAAALTVAHACGRIGCFMNGCCYGDKTDSIFGVHYPVGSDAYNQYGGAAVHPSPIYETIENLALFGLLCLMLRTKKRGISISVYFIAYGTLRFINEFWRGDNNRFFFNTLTIAQVIGLVLVPTGLLMLWHFVHAKRYKA
ncbi:MAG: prolipoprotein diacylglyceryl transferase [Victivallaceae bacterium]|nr:prolipoprotein diacylglyceryl transferase [Victivallaceae bacterium]